MRPGIKFLRSLFEVSHLEFQTYDVSNHRLLFSSGITRQLLGYTDEEYHNLSGDFYRSIIHPEDFHIIQETIDKIRIAKNGEVAEMTLRLRKSNGEFIWVYSRQMVYERKDHSQVFTIIREVEDVTKLVELQQQLGQKVEQLKDVSYKNSHLLRSPVASIMGLIDLIQEEDITGEHNRQIFHFLKETISKLDTVIHEINDVARLE